MKTPKATEQHIVALRTMTTGTYPEGYMRNKGTAASENWATLHSETKVAFVECLAWGWIITHGGRFFASEIGLRILRNAKARDKRRAERQRLAKLFSGETMI